MSELILWGVLGCIIIVAVITTVMIILKEYEIKTLKAINEDLMKKRDAAIREKAWESLVSPCLNTNAVYGNMLGGTSGLPRCNTPYFNGGVIALKKQISKLQQDYKDAEKANHAANKEIFNLMEGTKHLEEQVETLNEQLSCYQTSQKVWMKDEEKLRNELIHCQKCLVAKDKIIKRLRRNMEMFNKLYTPDPSGKGETK